MNSALERLLGLRVKDVMNGEVAALSEDLTMDKAAKLLVDQMVSGAPVVDKLGCCVGVLTATDFLRYDLPHREDPPTGMGAAGGKASTADAGCAVDTKVAAWMARSVETIRTDDSILSAARRMCGSHIHRLFVVDHEGKPIGVVSTLDLVSAMVLAFEE
jgi:predicted transcriptional regulator